MFALSEIQRSADTITLSSLPSQVGWVYRVSAPLETDYTSVDKRICPRFTFAWDRLVIILSVSLFFFFFARSCQSCNASRTRCPPGKQSRWTTRQFTHPGLIAGSQRNVSEMKMMAQACRGSQSSLGPSQSVLNGLHQCVIAITRSSQGPRQDELYSSASQQIFFFSLSFLLRLECISPLKLGVWMCDCLCLWNTSQSVYLFSFLEGALYCVSVVVDWQNHGMVCVYMPFK